MSNGTDTQEFCCAAGACCGGRETQQKRVASLATWIRQHVPELSAVMAMDVAAALFTKFDLAPKGSINLEPAIELAKKFGYADHA